MRGPVLKDTVCVFSSYSRASAFWQIVFFFWLFILLWIYAGKTGTAENADHSDNLTFIGFAPYENPEIAVAVVIEYGGKGDAAKETAKAVFEAYFAETLQKEAKNAETTVTEGTEWRVLREDICLLRQKSRRVFVSLW